MIVIKTQISTSNGMYFILHVLLIIVNGYKNKKSRFAQTNKIKSLYTKRPFLTISGNLASITKQKVNMSNVLVEHFCLVGFALLNRCSVFCEQSVLQNIVCLFAHFLLPSLYFDLQDLITPLVFDNFSYNNAIHPFICEDCHFSHLA